VETIEYRAAAAGHSVVAEDWLAYFDSGFARIAGRFGRVEHHVGDRTAVGDDTLDEQAPAMQGQSGITVGHSDLRSG
jgi:hypothetical protein